MLHVDPSKVKPSTRFGKSFLFEVHTVKREFFFQAGDNSDFDEWMDALEVHSS